MWTYNYSYELYHHGIKGQKWGIRRYQNEDGSLTEAGKKKQLMSEYRSARKDYRSSELRYRKAAREDKKAQSRTSSREERYEKSENLNKAFFDSLRKQSAFRQAKEKVKDYKTYKAINVGKIAAATAIGVVGTIAIAKVSNSLINKAAKYVNESVLNSLNDIASKIPDKAL